MSHKANLRRLKALTALVAPTLFMVGTLATGPLYAQGVPSPANGARDKFPGGAASGNRKSGLITRKTSEDRRTVGSWSFVSQSNQSRARLLPEKIKTPSGGKREGGSFRGGRAEIKIEYWSIPGPRNGFSGELVITSRSNLGGYKTHLFVDGKEIDSFTMGGMRRAGAQRRDLKELFGKNLEGLAKARNMRVTMDIDGKSYDLFEVDFEGTAALMEQMRRGPDANYAANRRTSSRRSGLGDAVPLGVTGPSTGQGQFGPWHYGVGGTKADAKLNLKNVNAQGSEKFIQTARGGLLDENPPRGGSANIEVVYESAPGSRQGFSGDLVVTRIGESGSYPVHVFVDGKEIDSFTLSEPIVRRDLKRMFGDDLAGLREAKTLRVTLDIDGKSHDILDVSLFDKRRLLHTAGVTASRMKDWADRNYRLLQEQKIEAAPRKCNEFNRGLETVSSVGGIYGPWHYRYSATQGSGKLYLSLDSNNHAAEGAKKFIKAARGGVLDKKPPRGGSANIEFFYGSARAQNQGFGGNLVVYRIGESGSYPVHVFVDGKEADSFTLGGPVVKRDLKTMFGENLSGLRKAKDIRVVMDIDGESYDILALDMIDQKGERNTADVVATNMEKAAERYDQYVRKNGQEIKRWCSLARKAPRSGGGGKKCFITTACCEMVGLEDDCFELTTLRRFRDRVLAPTANGRHDIHLYYALAPLVLAEMRRQGEEGRLLHFYFSHILPCALGARVGLEALPRRLYHDMMRRLVGRYWPDHLDLIGLPTT